MTRRARPTKTDLLQSAWDALLEAHPEYDDVAVEFRPFHGWFVVYSTPAFFGDDGQFIGRNYAQASEYIRGLYH
jgi:hypothetical protein